MSNTSKPDPYIVVDNVVYRFDDSHPYFKGYVRYANTPPKYTKVPSPSYTFPAIGQKCWGRLSLSSSGL